MSGSSTRRTQRWAVLASTALALSLSACSGSTQTDISAGEVTGWDSIVEAAKDESLVIYSVVPPEQTDALVNAFREEFPDIDVNATVMTGEFYAKIEQEVNNNLDGGEVFLMASDTWITENTDAFIDLTADVPAAAAWPQWVEEKYAPALGMTTMTYLGWNTESVPGGLEDWSDLLRPEFKGKIGLRSDMTAALASILQFWEDTQGPEFLPAIANQDPRFYPGVQGITQAVVSNEVPVQMIGALGTLYDLQDKGAPIDFVIPKDTWAMNYTALALKKSKNLNAAKVFLEFAMSEKGQSAFNGNGMGASPIGAPGGLDLSDHNVTLFDPSVTDPAAVEEWKLRYEEIFHS